jgi:hypothetical protein
VAVLQHVPFNKQGRFHLSTVEQPNNQAADAMTGVVESPRFVVRGKAASFLIGGGDRPATYVTLYTAAGKEVLRAGGTNSPVLRRVRWDVWPWIGQEVYLRVVDRKTHSWAHITFDDFSVDERPSTP